MSHEHIALYNSIDQVHSTVVNDIVYRYNTLLDEYTQVKEDLEILTQEYGRVSTIVKTQSSYIDQLKQELVESKKHLSFLENPVFQVVQDILRSDATSDQIRDHIDSALKDEEDRISEHVTEKVQELIDDLRIEVKSRGW